MDISQKLVDVLKPEYDKLKNVDLILTDTGWTVIRHDEHLITSDEDLIYYLSLYTDMEKHPGTNVGKLDRIARYNAPYRLNKLKDLL